MTDCPGRGNPASPGPKMFVGSSALKNLSSRAQRSGVERSTHPRAGNRPMNGTQYLPVISSEAERSTHPRAGNRPMNGTQYPPCHLERSREIHAPPSREASIGSSAGTISVPTAGKREDPSTPLRCARDDRHFSAEEPPYPHTSLRFTNPSPVPSAPLAKPPAGIKKTGPISDPTLPQYHTSKQQSTKSWENTAVSPFC